MEWAVFKTGWAERAQKARWGTGGWIGTGGWMNTGGK